MTTQMKSLVFAAAVAILPVACGTSGSPTGPETTIEAGLSSQRFSPGLPPSEPQPPSENAPSAPQAPSETVPTPQAPSESVPSDPGTVPGPAPEPTPKPVNDPSEGTRPPLPSSRPAQPTRPAPPSGGGVPENVPEASPEAIPAPPVSDPGSIPTGAPTTAVPPPAPLPQPAPLPAPPADTNTCTAASIEILPVLTFAETAGDEFVAVLTDASGAAIEDKSCETLTWTADGIVAGGRLTIVLGADSRSVTIFGATGPYKLGATAPNGKSVSITVGASL